MVLLTPYVLKTPQEALDETRRLFDNSKNSDSGWHKGWSDSPLPRKPEEVLRAEKERIKAEEDSKGHQRMKKQTLLDTFAREQPPAEPVTQGRSLSDEAAPVVTNAANLVPAISVTPPVEKPEAKPVAPVDPSESPSSAADAPPGTPVPMR
jgi:hypothetical protein